MAILCFSVLTEMREEKLVMNCEDRVQRDIQQEIAEYEMKKNSMVEL